MSSNILPKYRVTTRQSFYTAGEVDSKQVPSRFKAHSAEPGEASKILERNSTVVAPHHSQPRSKIIRSGYTPGLFSGKSEAPAHELSFAQEISSLTEVNLIKSKEFAK